jgi:hypothetical protein
MFGLFKRDPVERLRRDYQKKLEEALSYERNGDLRTSSTLRMEAEALYESLQAAEAESEPRK